MKWIFSLVIAACITTFAPASAQSPQVRALLMGPGTASSASGCAEATAFTSARSGTTGNAAYITAICDLVTNGLYAKLDVLYMFGQDTQANSQLSLIQRSGKTYNLTEVGGPTWTIGASGSGGYAGGCCGAYVTAYNPSTATAPQWQQDSASLFIWMNASGNRVAGTAAGNDTYLYADTTFYAGINSAATYACASSGVPTGLVMVTRTGPTAIAGYANGSGTAKCTATDTSAAVANQSVSFGRGDSSSTAAQYIVGGAGGKLTAAEQTTLYNIIHTMLTSIAGYP